MEFRWLPKTCGYRTVTEGGDFEPLVSGDPDTIHQAGISIKGKAISEDDIIAGDLLRYFIIRPTYSYRGIACP